MTERPGRKALFSGAGAPSSPSERSTEEIAAHVRQLNEEIAASLSSAVAGRAVSPLDAMKFGVEYTTLIGAVNALFAKLDSDRRAPVPAAPSADTGVQVVQYEEIISELKNRLEMMVDRNPIPMLVTTPAFSITEANDAFVQMSGLSQENLKNTSLAGFKLISQKGEGAKVALQEKRRSFGEVTIELPSGQHILNQYCIPLMGNDRTITSLLFVYIDITRQSKKNEEIEQLKHRSEAIVQQNPMPILLVDKTFHIRVANEAYATISGIARNDLVKMTLHDFKVLEQTGEGLKRVFSERHRSKGEVLVEFPSGVRRLQQYGIPIEDASGNVSSIVIVYNDITEERKKLDEIHDLVASQQESQQVLQKKMEEVATLKQRSDIIVKQNPMPIMLMDTAFKIIMVNEAYITLTGLSKDRLLGMSARDFTITSQKGEGLKKVITEKKRSFGEVTIQFPAGLRILEQYGIPILDAKGNLTTLLCVYNDVTLQREQETQIKQMMDEAKANTELLTVSATELQTALARIAAGDLTYRVSIDEADPLVKLKVDYNAAAVSIQNVLGSLMDTIVRLNVTLKDTIK
ncbi:MAG: PAS domain S-box protein, partial [Methanoregula sp.]|nr:PAS domain S-box protein [Methanoregula sp.]